MKKGDLRDSFFKKAKKEGYRARSIYKLKEIQERYGLIDKGDYILDLGCSPGSFLQFMSDTVGEKGWVLGIDILPTPYLNKINIKTIQADIKNVDIKNILAEHSMGFFDVVTCDIAPNLTGIRETDDKNIYELYEAVRNIVQISLKKGGDFIFKSFFTDTFKPINTELKTMFKKVIIYKPRASRTSSPEVYLICQGKIQGP
ncbi:MAG: RlmE family RNA methyltransferase [Syntrophorhabdaceae bacterium]|nr:RlmE family RNA methyltransferase [Syntrophorhabdales bacterium]MBP9560541.1 RlmE family RNA methyltransferase [Syntrophorhabdaceae bacterium]